MRSLNKLWQSRWLAFASLGGLLFSISLLIFGGPRIEAQAAAPVAETPRRASDSVEARRILAAVGNYQAGLTAQQIKAGRDTFIGACAECHVLYDPTWYAPEDWDRIFNNMRGRAKLSGAQFEDLKNFIRTVRGQ